MTGSPDGMKNRAQPGWNEEDETSSLSVGLSKLDADEDTGSDGADGTQALSNEKIRKNDTFAGIYKVTSDAKSGAMGSVWRVYNRNWDISLAMKRPQPQYFAEGGRRRRKAFIDECDNWIRLGLHPNIVSCFYVRSIAGVPSVFAEWMDGGSLQDRIEDGTLYEGSETDVRKRILDIAVQTARGLQYAHQNGLVHQDVKPANILLTNDWDAKAADFGLARAMTHLQDHEKPLSAGHTPAFCPEEQMQGAAAEKWMDVYAWALTVMTMYAGRLISRKGSEAFNILFADTGSPFSWKIQPPAKLTEAFRQDYYLKENGPSGTWRSFAAMEELLDEVYEDLTGEIYPRESFFAANDTAEALNNRAMSYLDLGMNEKAEECWHQALRKDPGNFDACINEGLFLWRSAKTTDLDMKARFEHFKTLYKYHRPGSRQIAELRKKLLLFREESSPDPEAPVPEGGRITLKDNAVTADLTEDLLSYLRDNDLRIRSARAEGETAVYEMMCPDMPNEVFCTIRFDLGSGACCGIAEGNTETAHEESVPSGEYVFRVQIPEDHSCGSGGFLEITEPDTGRVLRSVAMDEADAWRDEDGVIHHEYPILYADHAARRLVFFSPSEFRWSSYAMPVPQENSEKMTYTLMVPVSSRTRIAEDTERRAIYRSFREAAQNRDFTQMQAAYAKIWELPLAENSFQDDMNRELMKQCRLPGTYRLDNGMGVVISGHDPADPLPESVISVLPLADPTGSPSRLPAGGAFRDTFETTVFYYPVQDAGNEPTLLRVAYLDRKDGKQFERTVQPELQGEFICGVTGVSANGKYILLELRENGRGNGPDDPYAVVCFAQNGMRISQIYAGRGECRLKAVFIEDGQYAPDRGYLYEPMTDRILYFENGYDRFYTDCGPASFRDREFAIPLPEELVRDDRYDRFEDRPHEVIESLTLSQDGQRMVIVSAGAEGNIENKITYLYDSSLGDWRRIPCGRPQKVILGSHTEHLLIGRPEGSGHASWIWTLFPLDFQADYQRPVFEFREFTPETHISSIGYDRCSLLDENGLPVYAVCWKYRAGNGL
ncbi:MAG: protein kinase [Solobacterium sp.]|nr:protein kinase [Solobacterium sp.]